MMAESDSDSDSDEAEETARGARPAPPPMLAAFQMGRNSSFGTSKPTSACWSPRRGPTSAAASRPRANNISALAELNRAVATATEENDAADREPEPTPIDREAFEAPPPASPTTRAPRLGASVLPFTNLT